MLPVQAAVASDFVSVVALQQHLRVQVPVPMFKVKALDDHLLSEVVMHFRVR